MRPRQPIGASVDPTLRCRSPRPPQKPTRMTACLPRLAPLGSITAHLRCFGQALRAARGDRSYTVLRQAGLAGLTSSAVERIERGDCTASFGEVMALCASLDLKLTTLPAGAASSRKVGD